jgi:DNA-binding LytR/AlgR family response regulator
VNDRHAQSTLRQLQVFFRAPRYWMTVFVVVLVFTITGPFGTLSSMPLLQRFSFWMLLHGMAFSIASLFAVAADGLLAAHLPSRLFRMLIGAALAAIPIGLGVSLLQAGFMGDAITQAEILHQMAISLPLCITLCLLTYLTTSAAADTARPAASTPAHLDEEHGEPSPPPASSCAAPPAILARLKPDHRGRLLRLSVEDHYTQVVTARGRELVLLRFADALNETGETAGRRIHRSHWVADAYVKSLIRQNGKLFVVTLDDTQIPVSRPYEAEIRAAFASDAGVKLPTETVR